MFRPSCHSATGSSGGASGDSAKGKISKIGTRRRKALSKVVIQRLPPTLTKEQLQDHLQPTPEHNYFEFFSNDISMYLHVCKSIHQLLKPRGHYFVQGSF